MSWSTRKADEYNQFWARYGGVNVYAPSRRMRMDLIRQILTTRPVDAVFDCGCGDGMLIALVRTLLPGCHIVGMDISPHAIAHCRVKFPDGEFIVGDLEAETLVSGCNYPMVICSEVIEHLVDWRRGLLAAWRLVAPGGWLVLTTQAGRVTAVDRLLGHTRHFVLDTLTDPLIAAGATIEEAYRIGFPFMTVQNFFKNRFPRAIERSYLTGKMTTINRIVLEYAYRAFRFSLRAHALGPQIVIVARRTRSV